MDEYQISKEERELIKENVDQMDKLGLLEDYAKMVENQIIEETPPQALKLYIKSFEALNISEDRNEAMAKVLKQISIMCGEALEDKSQFNYMAIMKMCTIWALHLEGKLPGYAYEEVK